MALTAAISDALRSKALLDLLIPALTEAIADKISNDIHKAMQLELQSRDTRIGQLEQEVRHLYDVVDAHEQCSRRNWLIVHGIPETTQLENTDKVVIGL